MVIELLNKIIKFIKSFDPSIIIQAPSRVNLINPLDAVEGDFWMPSVAINGYKNPLSTFVYIKEIQGDSRFIFYKIVKSGEQIDFKVEYKNILIKNKKMLKKGKNSLAKLVYASIYRFSRTNSLFWKKYKEKNIEVGIISTIPRQSGLGGSASIIIATLYAFAKYFNIYNNFSYIKNKELPINKDIIAELATKVEDEDLKITAGYSDRYTISRGGLGFCSYSGKLLHRKISMEPIAIYDRIDKVYKIKSLPLIVCYSGVLHDSGNIHTKLRKLYLEKDLNILKRYRKMAKIAWKSRFALMKHDWKLLGKFFKKNNQIMNEVMHHAGFKYGIGLANNLLIKLIEDHPDVYAVKLTGAGGGGSVFALVNIDKIEDIMLEWKQKLKNLIKDKELFKFKFPEFNPNILEDLKKAEFFRIKISQDGVKEL
ncbi:MAG: mevalonate kinase [Promethearchaeota archaeon]